MSSNAHRDIPVTTDSSPLTLPALRDIHTVNENDPVVVRFDKVTKVYRLYENDAGRILSIFPWMRNKHLIGERLANDELSFEIRRGEAVSFLGSNGAGKSTLLKMIAGVAYPTSGSITVNGRVSALLEITAGFDSQLTGRDNLRMRATAIGMTDEQIAEIEPAVLDFAELGVYIDQPLRTYSSGMRARLGFALAVATQPDILIIDEALSVGDKRFKEKCLARIREIMMNGSVTVLFVTHTLDLAKEFCTRGIVIENGHLTFDGKIDEAVAFYEES